MTNTNEKIRTVKLSTIYGNKTFRQGWNDAVIGGWTEIVSEETIRYELGRKTAIIAKASGFPITKFKTGKAIIEALGVRNARNVYSQACNDV